MYQPNSEANHYLDTWNKVVEVFGYRRANDIWRWTTYSTFKDNRDFYNVLNEHPDVLAYCEERNKEQGIRSIPFLFGNVWGRPYSEDK